MAEDKIEISEHGGKVTVRRGDYGVLYGQDIWAIDQGHGVYIY